MDETTAVGLNFRHGTDLGFGSAFDRFDGSAFVWFPMRRVSPFLSPSLFAR